MLNLEIVVYFFLPYFSFITGTVSFTGWVGFVCQFRHFNFFANKTVPDPGGGLNKPSLLATSSPKGNSLSQSVCVFLGSRLKN